MNLKAKCQTTAMGIMPHTDIEQALHLALSLDIPFLPQLSKHSFTEDMYVLTSQNFPGISLDLAGERVVFDTERFAEELEYYSQKLDQTETYLLHEGYSVALPRFLEMDLSRYSAIRGQLAGPVSLGFRITDENHKPIIYNEAVRTLQQQKSPKLTSTPVEEKLVELAFSYLRELSQILRERYKIRV